MKEKKQTHYFYSGARFSPFEFSNRLESFVREYYQKKGPCPILFLCIGSDRITGDSLGPLVGYKLEQRLNRSAASDSCRYRVLGTLSRPVHALNLKHTINILRHQKTQFLTIAIDASVGHRESCGCITISNQALAPGEGVNRSLPHIGQISITGIVSDEDNELPFHLQNVRLNSIMQLADCIYQGLVTFLLSYNSQLPDPKASPDVPDKMYSGRQVSACASDLFQDAPHRFL